MSLAIPGPRHAPRRFCSRAPHPNEQERNGSRGREGTYSGICLPSIKYPLAPEHHLNHPSLNNHQPPLMSRLVSLRVLHVRCT